MILSFATLVFGLYSTYVYQTGLADLLYSKFRGPFWALTIYFTLSVSHHVWIVFNYEQMPYSFQWPTPLTALFIIQRLCKLIILFKNFSDQNVWKCSFYSLTNLLLSLQKIGTEVEWSKILRKHGVDQRTLVYKIIFFLTYLAAINV